MSFAVSQQPADGQYRLALQQGEARIGVSQIVQPDIGQPRRRSHGSPAAIQRLRPHGSGTPGRGKDPVVVPGQTVENRACGR